MTCSNPHGKIEMVLLSVELSAYCRGRVNCIRDMGKLEVDVVS